MGDLLLFWTKRFYIKLMPLVVCSFGTFLFVIRWFLCLKLTHDRFLNSTCDIWSSNMRIKTSDKTLGILITDIIMTCDMETLVAGDNIVPLGFPYHMS